MKQRAKVASLILALLALLSCSKNEPVGQMSQQENPELRALTELQAQIKQCDAKHSINSNENRCLKQWWRRFCDRVSSIAYADAGGAAGGYDRTIGQSWEKQRYAIVSGAVRASWEEFFNPTMEEKSEREEEEVRSDAYLDAKKISSLGDLRESESLDGTLSDRPVNVMDGIGRAHNEVLFNMSKRAEEYQGRSKEYVLSHLRSETDAVLQRADNYDYSHSLRSLGQEASKEDGSRHGEEECKTDPYSKALEDEILRDYSHSIASEESLQGTKSYYDEVSKLVQESNVSEETRVRMLVFISVATHSKALWSKVVEQEVASDH